jgi:flavin reductase (DIM6/NTAB) family NADH-FMN oxidoreductase RutF
MKKVKLGPQKILYPLPTTLIGSLVNGQPTFMTAAWATIVDPKPPSLAISISKNRYTLIGIKENNAFSVNIPSTNMVKVVDYCGIYSGKKQKKANLFKVFYGELGSTAPLIEECPVNYECRLAQCVELQNYILVIGEITELHIDTGCVVEGKINPALIDPLIYAPDIMNYYQLGKFVAKAFSIGKQLAKK